MKRLFDLPHHEATARLHAGAIAWVTVNPVEYHGPHLPLHTDRLQSEAWIGDLHEALGEPGEALLACDLEMGVDPAFGPGSRHVPFRTVRDEAVRAGLALAELGATRVGFVTFHGAPLHNLALHHAVVALRRLGVAAVAPFQAVVRLLLETSEVDPGDAAFAMLPDAQRLVVAAALPWDFHAGYFETSLMLHWAPQAVSADQPLCPPCPPVRPDRRMARAARLARRAGRHALADELDYAAVALGWQQLDPFPGYTGFPGLASAEAGACFAELVLERSVELCRRALAGSPDDDRPPMGWVGPLTAWGRVSP